MTKNEKLVLGKAKAHFSDNPDVRSVSFGYKYKNGAKTGAIGIIVGVEEKLSLKDVVPGKMIPEKYLGFFTDVQERKVEAYTLQTTPRSHVGRMRPCPPGFSIGHYLITAGTLGCYVKHGASEDWLVLSNNHVLANSNDAQPNDVIRQPGRADGGTDSDRFAYLEEWVKINWDGENGNGGCNIFARAWFWLHRIRVIEQPKPNLVDAAIARPILQSYVETDVFGIGPIAGIRDLELGDRVQKVGRTTEHTVGTVEGVGTMVKVQYGAGKVATYDDQLEIRADSGDFSAGGDSGSSILTLEEEPYIGGLLFAGSSGSDPVTISNRISNVMAILGVRL